jgi:hypothetical protein
VSFYHLPNPYNPGYAIPDYVMAEPPERGTFTTQWLPRGTIPTLVPDFLAKPGKRLLGRSDAQLSGLGAIPTNLDPDIGCCNGGAGHNNIDSCYDKKNKRCLPEPPGRAVQMSMGRRRMSGAAIRTPGRYTTLSGSSLEGSSLDGDTLGARQWTLAALGADAPPAPVAPPPAKLDLKKVAIAGAAIAGAIYLFKTSKRGRRR